MNPESCFGDSPRSHSFILPAFPSHSFAFLHLHFCLFFSTALSTSQCFLLFFPPFFFAPLFFFFDIFLFTFFARSSLLFFPTLLLFSTPTHNTSPFFAFFSLPPHPLRSTQPAQAFATTSPGSLKYRLARWRPIKQRPWKSPTFHVTQTRTHVRLRIRIHLINRRQYTRSFERIRVLCCKPKTHINKYLFIYYYAHRTIILYLLSIGHYKIYDSWEKMKGMKEKEDKEDMIEIILSRRFFLQLNR